MSLGLPFDGCKSIARPFNLALILTSFAGCGVSMDVGTSEEGPSLSGDARLLEPRVVVMDWEPSHSDMLDNEPIIPIDLTRFYVTTGQTLADQSDFKARVADEVESILSELDVPPILVSSGRSDDYPNATRVLVSHGLDPEDPRRVGQAYYDPCDANEADEAIVWGQAMLDLGDEHTLDEWVHFFANVAAHELGHTLGFVHPDAGDDAARSLPESELMLASHSLASLLKPQAFLIPQDTCPSAGHTATNSPRLTSLSSR